MKELQSHALDNLKHKRHYEESGLATLRIKILHQNSPPRIISKEIRLSATASDLKNALRQDINTSVDRVKLICTGKVLKNQESLSDQNVQNGQLILAILLNDGETEITDNEKKVQDLENTKSDSRLLALDNEYMQLEDQFGNAVKIPSHEKKALVVAMTLHEKGRSVLKKKDYTRALIYFLEADEEYGLCNSQLLNTVDNYALLNLDIAWCYLCLESVAHLPEAERRLKQCERKFIDTYGANMERVVAVKGTPGNEAALLTRLHLLQAIVLYHQNKRSEAVSLLRKVESEINTLKVDEQSVLLLVELGYTPTEATLGLRATNGDVNHAANYIKENMEKRAESRKKARAEAELDRERKRLGLCRDGKQYIDPRLVKVLVDMGYDSEEARQALKYCNNVISDAVQHIQEVGAAGQSSSVQHHELSDIIEALVPELEQAGFDPRMARLALSKFKGDMTKAFEELLANGGIVSGDLSGIITRLSVDRIKERQQEENRKNEAFKRLKEDITTAEDDYLDIDLVEEEAFLKRYLTLLDKQS
ncbi:unnamed protein product [Acanthoscelides obtectus]|nr:unnamed protein product [Acanthoscelides obtectus]CAK1647228.1 NEDD8 ultimate buster 1 [Acanthoscelides obtectus]